MQHQFSENNLNWDYSPHGFWIGGHFPVSNSSNGVHGILKQWWDYYIKIKNPGFNPLDKFQERVLMNTIEFLNDIKNYE